MADVDVSQRLGRARLASGEDLATLACRIGVRQEHLRAIEEGRFADLPPGIYGRAAVRSFASACGLDPVQVLADVEAVLPQIEEPIGAMGRIRGLPQRRPRVRDTATSPGVTPGEPRPDWRPLVASLIDACVVLALLLLVVGAAATALVVPPSALRGAVPALIATGLVLAAGYFVWFGGLGGATFGERLAGVPPDPERGHILTLPQIGRRTLRSATMEIRCIGDTGRWLAHGIFMQGSLARGEGGEGGFSEKARSTP
jgi:hypothetical protein